MGGARGFGTYLVGVCLLVALSAVMASHSRLCRLAVGASVSRGVGWLTCGPRCPPSPRAVSSCQDGRHVIGTFAKAANSAQFWCSHAPSHSLCQSGCVLGSPSLCSGPSSSICRTHAWSPVARRMAVITGLHIDFARVCSGSLSSL